MVKIDFFDKSNDWCCTFLTSDKLFTAETLRGKQKSLQGRW